MQQRGALAWFLAFQLLVLAGEAHACRRPWPGVDDLPKYGAVVFVEVTGVRLTQYEEEQLHERGFRTRPAQVDDELDAMQFPWSDFEVTFLVEQVLQGKSEPLRTVTLGGCDVQAPWLQEKGFVFLDAYGQMAKAVWESDHAAFAFWQQHFGLEPVAADAGDSEPEPSWKKHCTFDGYHPADGRVLGPLKRRVMRCEAEDACVLACLRSNCATDTIDACEATCARREEPAIAADRFADGSEPMCKVRDAK